MGKDYYAILGISRDADDDTIKKAYRKLGMYFYSEIINAFILTLDFSLNSFKMASR
jgi:preprotein translocase subunit Sec63